MHASGAAANARAELRIKVQQNWCSAYGPLMSEASERTLLLLKELALLKEAPTKKGRAGSAERRKRRKEICDEIKQIAVEKKTSRRL